MLILVSPMLSALGSADMLAELRAQQQRMRAQSEPQKSPKAIDRDSIIVATLGGMASMISVLFVGELFNWHGHRKHYTNVIYCTQFGECSLNLDEIP